MRDRAQSETVGTVLLVGVVILVVGGLFVTGSSVVEDAQRDAPSAAMVVEANGSTVTVTHESGDALDVADLEAVFAADGTDQAQRLPLSAFATGGPSDGRLTAGETVSTTNPLATGEVTVRIVHTPSEVVLSKRSLSLAPGGVNFAAAASRPRDSAINRNSSSASIDVEDAGTTVNATGNGWWEVPYNYTVTPDTMLSFSFQSSQACEIHGIGLENDNTQTEGRVVRVYGDQNWGVPVDRFDGQSTYSGSGTTRYTVPIGQLYQSNGYLSGGTGRVDKLLFVNDCDSGPSSVNSRFENVRVYEGN